MPRPERPRPNMDPRAKSFADSLHFELQTLVMAIPVFIVCIGIAVVVDTRPQTIVWIAVGAAVVFSAVRAAVSWLRTALRSDPNDPPRNNDR